jgi:hypothetical protein
MMKKWLIGLALAVGLLGVTIFCYFTYIVPILLKDAYAQWVAAELVIVYFEDNNILPENWENLKTSFPDGKGLHHGGQSFEEVRDRIIIDFPKLPVLKNKFANKEEIPNVIKTKSNNEAHWSGAEPNFLVNEYFKNKKAEQGAALNSHSPGA